MYDGQENLCAFAPSTSLRLCVQRGRIISLSNLGRRQKSTQEDCHLLFFLSWLLGTWLAFWFKSTLPFHGSFWTKIAGAIFWSSLPTRILWYYLTINQKISVRTQKSSNSPCKCIDIQWCIVWHQLLLAMCVICLPLHGGHEMHHLLYFRLVITYNPVVWDFGIAINLKWHRIPFAFANLLNLIVTFSNLWHMLDHVWFKSATWQSPPTRGTILDHIWSKSAVWQSPPTRGTFWTTFGRSPQLDSVLQWGAHFGPHLVKFHFVMKSSNEGNISDQLWLKSAVWQVLQWGAHFGPHLVKVHWVMKSFNERRFIWLYLVKIHCVIKSSDKG